MWFLTLLSWLSTLLQILFATLAIASALYYLAEIIEEYTTITSKVIRVMLMISCAIYVGLWIFEGFPFYLVALGLFSNLVEFGLLRTFPFIQISSPNFILTVVLVLVNHYVAFQFFGGIYYSFTEILTYFAVYSLCSDHSKILTYFTLCLWLIPFTFFISLSAGDNILPSTMQPLLTSSSDNDVLSHYITRGKKKRSIMITIADGVKNAIFPSRSKNY